MTQNKKNFNFLKISFVCFILFCILLGSGVIQSHAAEGDDSSIWEEIERLDAQLNIALSKTDSNAADISALAQTISEIRTKLETLQTTSLSHATQQQLAALEESLEAADNTLASRIDALEADLARKYQQTTQNSADIEKLASYIDELEELVTALQSTSLSHATQQQLAVLEEALENADNILASRIDDLTADLANKYKQTNQNSADIAALADNIDELEELITALQSTSLSHATQQQLAVLQEKLDVADSLLQSKIDDLAAKLTVESSQIDKNSADIEKLASYISELEELVTALQNTSLSHATQQQLAVLEEALENADEDLAYQINALANDLQYTREQALLHSVDIATLASDIADIEELITVLQAASLSHATQQQLATLQKELEASIATLNSKLNELTSNLQSARISINENSVGISTLAKKIADIEEVLSALDEKSLNTATKQQLENLKTEVTESIVTLQNELTELKSELEQATANISDNSTSISKLSNSIATVQEAISTLETNSAYYVTSEQLDSLKKDLNAAIGILDSKIASNEIKFNNQIAGLTNQIHEQQKNFETYLIIIVSVVIACNLALIVWIVVIKKKHLTSKNKK